jgi:hypothetical protein
MQFNLGSRYVTYAGLAAVKLGLPEAEEVSKAR